MNIRVWLFGIVGALLGSSLALAADMSDLGQIVVTPYRYEGTLNKAVASVTVITPMEIADSNAQRVVDVLRTVSGLTVRDLYGNGTKAVVDMAGFGEQAALNVLVMVDGRRANDVDLSGVDWSQIPLDQVDRIEVMRGGSGAVLYGDNASSGVINIITKKGSDKPEVAMESQYGSYDMNVQKVSVSGGAQDNKLKYWLNGGRDVTHGYRQNTFSKAGDIGAKISYELTDRLSVRLDSGLHESSYGIPGALYQDNIDINGRRYARFVQDHANNKDYFFLMGAENDFQELGRLGLDFSYRLKDTDSYFLSSGNPTRRNRIDTYTLTPKYTIDKSVLDHENMFIMGLDYSRVYFSSINYNKTTDVLTSNTSINKTVLAGYMQDQLSLTDKLAVVGGYRKEAARFVFGYHDTTTPPWNSPDLDDKLQPTMEAINSGLVYSYKPDSNVFVNVSRSYRFPEVDEFTYMDENYKQQLKTSLQPQSAMNYQVGMRHKFDDGLKANFSLFRMNVKDELFYNSTYAYLNDPWSGWYWSGQNDNYAKTLHQGVETALEAKLTKRVSSFGNYTFTDARFDGGQYDNNEIPAVARHKATLGIRVLLPKDLTWNLMDTYVGPRYFYNDQANDYSRLNGYMVMDTNVSWRHKNMTVTFGINNLLNKKYSEYGGVRVTDDGVYGYKVGDKFYFPSAERNFNLRVDYKF